MTTVAQLIQYLQTLPPETTVNVAVNVDGNWSSYTEWEQLELPDNFSLYKNSDNIEFYSGTENSIVYFGRI